MSLPLLAPPSIDMMLHAPHTETEALTAMLMSWYMSGYHTGKHKYCILVFLHSMIIISLLHQYILWFYLLSLSVLSVCYFSFLIFCAMSYFLEINLETTSCITEFNCNIFTQTNFPASSHVILIYTRFLVKNRGCHYAKCEGQCKLII